MTTDPVSRSLHYVNHPLVQIALTILRDRHTSCAEFRRQAEIVSMGLVYEATRDLPAIATMVDTPLAPSDGCKLQDPVIVVPVLRAGMPMADVFLRLIPQACAHHLGLARDEVTAVAKQYYPPKPRKIDPASYILLADPMLATGGTAIDALTQIFDAGGRNVRMACVVAAQAGLEAVCKRYPDVRIYTPAVDADLNADSFIVPGLGDFGDRLFGTGN